VIPFFYISYRNLCMRSYITSLNTSPISSHDLASETGSCCGLDFVSCTTGLSLSCYVRGKIVSESGMRSAGDMLEMKPCCDSFLIGSSIMAHVRPEKKLEEIICA